MHTIMSALDEAAREREAAIYRPAAHNLSAALKDYGYVRIYSVPTIDAALASSASMDFILSNGGEVEVYFGLDLPKRITEPSILLGYPSWIVSELEFKAPSIVVSDTEKPEGLLPVPIVSRQDSSITAMMINILHEIGVVGDRALLAIIAGYWRGLDIGRNSSFIGAEKSIVDLLKVEGKIVEELVLRLFRWHEEKIPRSLYLTVEPYLPTLTGRRENIERFLGGDPRLQRLVETSVKEAPTEKLVVLGEKLYQLLKEKSKIARKAGEVVGNACYSESFPISDLREAAVLLAVGACSRGVESLIGVAATPITVMASIHYEYYSKLFRKLVDSIEDIINRGGVKKSNIGARIAVLDVEKPLLLLAERILKKMGYVPLDYVAVVGDEAALESLVTVQNYKWVYKALKEGCVEEGSKPLFFKLRFQRCKAF